MTNAAVMNALPHPDLHLHLSRLRSLGSTRPSSPVFEVREDAELAAECLSDELGLRHVATPVWWIEHRDVAQSAIIAWTTTPAPQ